MDSDKNWRRPVGSVPLQVRQFFLFNRIGLILMLVCLPAGVPAAAGQNARLQKAASDVAAATANYRAALERVLDLYERELARRNEMTDLRQDLFERGILSRREFEDGQRALADAQKKVDDTRQAIAEADRMLTEARLAESVARLAPLERGGYQETPGLVRYAGITDWSLTSGTAHLRDWFMARLGRPLPISAFGQTPLHDRMGLDHRNALDVAVHPDSPEGRALMDHLRNLGVPFIAAWGAIPGSTSGAHIHVGQPSPRVTARR